MREKSVFWKESFCKTRTDYAWTRARLRGQDFATGKNFSFSQGKLFYKSNRKLSPVFA